MARVFSLFFSASTTVTPSISGMVKSRITGQALPLCTSLKLLCHYSLQWSCSEIAPLRYDEWVKYHQLDHQQQPRPWYALCADFLNASTLQLAHFHNRLDQVVSAPKEKPRFLSLMMLQTITGIFLVMGSSLRVLSTPHPSFSGIRTSSRMADGAPLLLEEGHQSCDDADYFIVLLSRISRKA